MPTVTVSAPSEDFGKLITAGAKMSAVFQMGIKVFLEGGIEEWQKNQIEQQRIKMKMFFK